MRVLFVIFLMLAGAMVYNIGHDQKTPEESAMIIVDFIKDTFSKVFLKPQTEKEKLEALLQEAICNVSDDEKLCFKNQKFIIISGEKIKDRIYLSGFLLDFQKKIYYPKKITQEIKSDFIAVVNQVFDGYAVKEICTSKNAEAESSNWSRLYPLVEGKIECTVRVGDQADKTRYEEAISLRKVI